MASSREYLQFILGQLSELEDVSYRAMMGEFIIYYKGRIVGGIYDDRLLVKPVKSAIEYMSNATYELPYEGAKEMLLVDEVDSKEYLSNLFKNMLDELPIPKSKKDEIDKFEVKTRSRFFAFSKPPKVNDVVKYNHAVGKLWFSFATILEVMIVVIAIIIIYLKIEKKYRQQ